VLNADGERRRGEYERARAVAHEGAALNSYAYHSPKKMPRYKPNKKRGQSQKADQEIALAHARGFFRAMAARSKKKGET
jgi:hypothetical protein